MGLVERQLIAITLPNDRSDNLYVTPPELAMRAV